MKVLVTGGAGYVGCSLIDLLDKASDVSEIIVIDNLSSSSDFFFIGASPFEKVRFIKGDVLNYDLLAGIVNDVDVVYHLASYTNHAFSYAQNIQFEQVNQWGTLNLVRAIKDKAKNISKFYYLSSLLVHGFNNEIDLTSQKPQPTNAYGFSKLEAEKYILMLQNICEIGIMRSANIYGFNEGFRKDSVLNNFIFNAILNKKIIIYGDGEQQRGFVHIDRVASYLSSLLNGGNNAQQNETLIDFSSSMNEIKDWLLTQVEDLEYTYLNTNIKYDSQLISGVPSIEKVHQNLDDCFRSFHQQMRIRG